MLSKLKNLSFGAIAGFFIGFAAAGLAATTGTPPGTGFATVDGNWLNGLANGLNRSAQSGITAKAGGTQAAATALPAQVALVQVDTVATTGDSVYLPFCLTGQEIKLRNAGAGTLYVYGNATVNPATGGADTINGTAGSTAYQLATQTTASFFCAKNASWSAIKTG